MPIATLLGKLGVWLCDRFQPRPLTKLELAVDQQYVSLVIDVLRGDCRDYGRDREADHLPVIAERRDYEKLYGGRP